MEYLFSYGTLQREEVQLRLLDRLLKGEKDVLYGYKLVDIEIQDAAFVAHGDGIWQLTAVAASEDEIGGIVFEVSSEELDAIDRYEPENYGRIAVTLGSGKRAWLYLKAD